MISLNGRSPWGAAFHLGADGIAILHFMRFRLFTVVVAFWAGLASASYDKGAMCSGAKICLKADVPTCSVADKKPNPAIKYDAEFCRPYWELKNRGVQLQTPRALEIYDYLGREYRVTYQLKGVLPVNESMLLYLFEHMPFTAHLVNAYRNTKYTIGYKSSDRRNFDGDNGGNLSGRFYWMMQDSLGQHKGLRNVFWGYGRTKVMMWKMHGVAVVFLDLYPIDKKHTRYDLRAVVFPSNGFLNGIMKMDMFRSVVQDKIFEIVSNIDKASNAFAKGDRAPIQKYGKFKEANLAKQLTEFEAIVKGSDYDLGDAGKTYVPQPKLKTFPNAPKTKY